jgi:two-component system OmpR family response regulator
MKNTSIMDKEALQALIIDDETDVCYLLGTLLRQKLLKTSCVNTLADATEMLRKETPDIVFLDNHLPDGMGINYIETIREVSPTSKIIMISAYDTAMDKSKMMEKGVDYFIGKPFTRDAIYHVVDQLTTQ